MAKHPQYDLLAPSGKLARHGESITINGVNWAIAGWDARKRYIVLQRPVMPGEQNISPTGLQMPFVVKQLDEQTRFDLGYRWRLIALL